MYVVKRALDVPVPYQILDMEDVSGLDVLSSTKPMPEIVESDFQKLCVLEFIECTFALFPPAVADRFHLGKNPC